MPNFAQNSVVMSSMATKKYIWAYFRRKSMDLGPKKYTSRIEVPCPTPELKFTDYFLVNTFETVYSDILTLSEWTLLNYSRTNGWRS